VGDKIADFKPSYGANYSLILVIRNVNKGGIIHWELIKDTVDTDVFSNFLNNVKLPNEEKYYLLLDNIKFHHSKKVKEILVSKNIEPRYIVASNPYLNPVEEVFNVIKQYVKKQKPTTEEELRNALSKILNILQEEDLTKYFKNCLDFDFI
jgi:transposase